MSRACDEKLILFASLVAVDYRATKSIGKLAIGIRHFRLRSDAHSERIPAGHMAANVPRIKMSVSARAKS